MSLDYPIPDEWILTTLGDVLSRSDERVDPLISPITDTSYIGLENIEGYTGRLLPISSVFNEEIRSTKNIFHAGDILYGKLRPYLNKVYLAEKDGICSTDIWVLRPASFIDPEFGAYYLRSPYVLQRVSQMATGANLPRISATAFDKISISLPPLSEQRRIVSILRQADRLRQLRREAKDKAQQLLPALFDEMFGDPSINSKGWPMVPVENLLRSSPHYGTFDAAKEQGEYLTLRVGNIVEDDIDFSDKKFVNLSAADYKRFRVHDGDLLLIRAIGSASLLGKCAVYRGSDNKIVFDSHLMRLQFNLEIIVPEYFQRCLASKGGRIILSQYMRASAVQYNINTKEIRSIAIPVPPIQLQKDFLYKSTSFNKRYKALISNQQLDVLFQSLLAQAFSGELTAAWREEHEGLESIQVFPELVRPVEEKGLPIVEETVAETIDKMIGRVGVVAELSDEQRQILNLVLNTKGYCTVETLKATNNLPVHAIRKGLQLLTRIGLIQAVRLPDRPIRTIVYVPVYRVIDDGDVARTPDIGLLQQALQREMAL